MLILQSFEFLFTVTTFALLNLFLKLFHQFGLYEGPFRCLELSNGCELRNLVFQEEVGVASQMDLLKNLGVGLLGAISVLQ
jgi:hypothetical protein